MTTQENAEAVLDWLRVFGRPMSAAEIAFQAGGDMPDDVEATEELCHEMFECGAVYRKPGYVDGQWLYVV